MFWKSAPNAVMALSNWRTYVGLIEFLVLVGAPVFLVDIFAGRLEIERKRRVFLSTLTSVVVQLSATIVFVLTFEIIILGQGREAAWSLPWFYFEKAPIAIGKYFCALLIANMVFAFIPIIGRLYTVQVLVAGTFTVSLGVRVVENSYPGTVPQGLEFWPGYQVATELVALSLALGMFGRVLEQRLASKARLRPEALRSSVTSAAVGCLGLLPVFLYGAWVGAQLRSM
jgi:hypothetical protein